MKLKYLIEQNDGDDYDVDKYVKIILKDCKPFLKESKGKPLYRGMKVKENFLKKKIRTNRVSSQQETEYFNGANDAMKDSGFKAIRSNSILCVGSQITANDYGYVYRVFPIDKFNYTWSTKVEDYFDLMNTNIKSEKYDAGFKQFFKYKDSYKTTNLDEAILSRNEIMVSGKEYYAVRVLLGQFSKYTEFNTKLWNAIK